MVGEMTNGKLQMTNGKLRDVFVQRHTLWVILVTCTTQGDRTRSHTTMSHHLPSNHYNLYHLPFANHSEIGCTVGTFPLATALVSSHSTVSQSITTANFALLRTCMFTVHGVFVLSCLQVARVFRLQCTDLAQGVGHHVLCVLG